MKFPIGIQNFQSLREDGYAYVDKTALMYQLIQSGRYIFLSRPRRFGKSMLLSTIRAYYEGKKELFRGLALEKLATDWTPHPVFHFDLNCVEKGDPQNVRTMLSVQLDRLEKIYACEKSSYPLAARFANLLEKAVQHTHERVVVLIDEYDKPLLQCLESGEEQEQIRSILKSFYGVLKAQDEFIQFAMLTGVSKFSKVSIFSDLNNLRDVSLNRAFATICGLTKEEIVHAFDEQVGELALARHLTKEACYQELKKWYDGYHFGPNSDGVYNPFSLLNALDSKDFVNAWFTSGTPTFLVEAIKRADFKLAVDFNKPISADVLMSIDSVGRNPLPVLYQSGYLTIRDYDPTFKVFTLDFPNEEVREGFFGFLYPFYVGSLTEKESVLMELVKSLLKGDVMHFMACLQDLFSSTGNYMLHQAKYREQDYQNAFYIIFNLIGIHVQAELVTTKGRIDAAIETKDFVYIFEFKMDTVAEQALRQIESKNYQAHYANDTRKKFLVGAVFSSQEVALTDWTVKEV